VGGSRLEGRDDRLGRRLRRPRFQLRLWSDNVKVTCFGGLFDAKSDGVHKPSRLIWGGKTRKETYGLRRMRRRFAHGEGGGCDLWGR